MHRTADNATVLLSETPRSWPRAAMRAISGVLDTQSHPSTRFHGEMLNCNPGGPTRRASTKTRPREGAPKHRPEGDGAGVPGAGKDPGRAVEAVDQPYARPRRTPRRSELCDPRIRAGQHLAIGPVEVEVDAGLLGRVDAGAHQHREGEDGEEQELERGQDVARRVGLVVPTGKGRIS